MKILSLLVLLRMVDSRSLADSADLITDICPDETFCYNGSKCMKLEKGFKSPIEGRAYRCDCTLTANNGFEFYAGYGCDYDATEYCLDGPYATVTDKRQAFCTNGSCEQNIILNDGETPYHPGCICNEGFDGDYCEYKTGETPYKKSSGIPLGLGISIPLVLVGVGSGFLWKKKSEKKKQDTPDIPTAMGDAPDIPAATEDLRVDHKEMV